jgi:hypothetical protein
MHFAIMVGGTGPTESIAAVARSVAHLCRAATRARVPLSVPRGGCARRDKNKVSERAPRVVSKSGWVFGAVSLEAGVIINDGVNHQGGATFSVQKR